MIINNNNKCLNNIQEKIDICLNEMMKTTQDLKLNAVKWQLETRTNLNKEKLKKIQESNSGESLTIKWIK